MKKIEINENYTKFEDGSFEVKCKDCGIVEKLEADNKFAVRYSQIDSSANEHLCLKCWKKQQDNFKQFQKSERERDILMGQARNLAQADIHSLGLKITDGSKYWNALDKYQLEHFEKLKKGRQIQRQNGSG